MPNPNKRRFIDDEDDEPEMKRQRSDYESIKADIRLLLPSRNAGAVIGKGGENVKRIRQEFVASVNLPDCHGPERLMKIRGDIGQICAIIEDIIPILDKPRQGEEGECEVRFLVHQSLAGRIIGRAGSRIKKLKEECNTAVRMFSECAPQSTDRVCQVIGYPDRVVHCIGLILDMLDGTPILGQTNNYNPDHFDDDYADQYGGFGESRGRPGGRDGRPLVGRSRGGRDYDRGGRDNDRGGRDYDRREGGRDYGGRGDDRGFGRGGAEGLLEALAGFSGNMGALGGGLNALAVKNLLGGMSKTTSSQVSVPKSLAGAIIGKGGTRIRQVQMESGTVINMDDASVNTDERIITIHGTQDQIQYAQYLLQMTIKQFINE